MKTLALAALLALASPLALAAIPVVEIPTTQVVTVTDGVGCDSMDALKIFYQSREAMIKTNLLGTQRCFLVDAGETYQTIDGTLNNGTIQLIVQDGTTRIIPTFVFGNHQFR